MVLVSPSSHTTLHSGYYVVDLPLPGVGSPSNPPVPVGAGTTGGLGGELAVGEVSDNRN